MGDIPETTLSLVGDELPATTGARLLVIDGASSVITALPSQGTLSIGRAPECEIRLADPACSRRHAQLHMAAGEITLEDLGSHNGTRVNGEPMQGRRMLSSDDVIAIGPIRLVLHASQRVRSRVVLAPAELRERLAQEVERAGNYERPLSVAVFAISHIDGLLAALDTELRLVDMLGKLDERHAVVLMPELVPEAAVEVGVRVLAIVAPHGVTSIGVAHCPSDACAPDALVAAARAALELGPGVHQAAECVKHVTIGNLTALVADASMIQVYELIKRLAASELTVLVHGETGVGKEIAAHAIHAWSRRDTGPFVAINCASLPESLVESELFGYEKGAFSSATTAKPGRLEAAAGGTVFLDEIGELALAVQAKLLRVLDARQATRLGGIKDYAVDIRVVAATHRNLEAEVKAGRFREDLYFRLGGARVSIPPLRDRPRELSCLARFFLSRAAAGGPELSAAALAVLARYPWPGNIRELRNEMELVGATFREAIVEPWHLSERVTAAKPTHAPQVRAEPITATLPRFRPINDELRELERRRMAEALAATGGVQKKAAELIGMPLRTFTMKYKQYGFGDK